ncbi:MAG: type I glyceraldehyde-3-phosphate dehydrogenase [Candidatus Eisenbacteria bacterium]|nr:type I glyceraldehyde-3-phosphate dehydrogenase [Candidatus Latescibacterota bacterium]MBD3301626.1 type I glyceraldehyde-3-phosphate dehydrogenase [Candidatus Eisenbacteria bacterium]
MSTIRIGINGFGRIGRCVFKLVSKHPQFEVAAINDLADISDLAYLLKYDSVHGWYPSKVENTERALRVDDREIPFFANEDPESIPWGELGADIVIESTGAFRQREKAARHLKGGAKRVIISAPSTDADGTFLPGINTGDFDPERHTIVSMASCTTNCLAPVAKVLNDRFGIEHLVFTTVHAYTSSQSLMDIPTRKRRRGRAAAVSIIPTSTGAAVATTQVLPELEGKLQGMAMRVPVPDGSITDIVAMVGADVTPDAVNDALREAAAKGDMAGILRVTDEALVSRDIIGDTHSSIVDAQSTSVLRDRVVKVLSWYDNEWGYSARLVDFAGLVSKRIG